MKIDKHLKGLSEPSAQNRAANGGLPSSTKFPEVKVVPKILTIPEGSVPKGFIPDNTPHKIDPNNIKKSELLPNPASQQDLASIFHKFGVDKSKFKPNVNAPVGHPSLSKRDTSGFSFRTDQGGALPNTGSMTTEIPASETGGFSASPERHSTAPPDLIGTRQ